MRKHVFSLLAFLFITHLIWAIDPSTTLTTYYASIDGKAANSSDDLRKTLCTIISTGYTSIGYSSLPSQMYGASSNPTDFVNGTGSNATMEDIYSSKPYKMSDSGSSASTCGTGWNKEHTVPQSWFNEQSPMKSDAHHVYPTDIRMNSLRSSYPYGENDAAKGCATWGYGSVGPSTFPGYTGTVFDPGEGGEYGSYKGDLARTYFYMATRYRTTNFTNGSGSTSFTYTNGVADLTPYMTALMLKWHREDPVSPKELNRNNAIYAHQHNRNPFIDYPELVEYIWGNKKGQTVNLAALVSGYSDEPTPPSPLPGPMYGVTWSANGEVLYTDSIPEEASIMVLPEMPVSCSSESNIFMGWTTTPIDSISDEAPAVLYITAEDFPHVNGDVTYYAVFARMVEMEPSLPATYIFDAEHQQGWTNTATDKGSYWLLKEGTSIVSPQIDLMYLESIKVKMRTYGGTNNKILDITTDFGPLTTIEATEGSTITEYTWNNRLYIAGISALTFTSSYGTNGVGVQSIVIEGAGTADIYCCYITSCQETTELSLITDNRSALTVKKVLVGNEIYIQINDQLFNLQGQRVK
ncbi:MAG: endonuclease [Paludibacteraceae bacterium]|nr:endonuclease [Paludibacteraceae bacterium]